MPLYEYECEACGRRIEVIQRFSDDPLSECTECGGELRRLLSAPAVQFKGSGWYVTDYAGKGGASSSGNGDGSGADDKKKPAATESSSASSEKTSTGAKTGTAGSAK